MIRSFRLAFIAVLMAAMALAGAPVTSAHTVRIGTDPAENAAMTQGPARVSATFNEQLQPEFAAMTVVGPDGNLWSNGDPQVQGAVISVGVRPLGPSGTYTVNYRVTSADGHPVSGLGRFGSRWPRRERRGRRQPSRRKPQAAVSRCGRSWWLAR